MKKELGILAAGAAFSITGCTYDAPNRTPAPIQENPNAVIVDLGRIGRDHEIYKITDKDGQDCYVVVNTWAGGNAAISCPVETK